jgi:hypothetical protein
LTIMQFRVKLNLVSQLVLPLPSCQMWLTLHVNFRIWDNEYMSNHIS